MKPKTKTPAKKSNRGGRRPGSGQPKKEPTITIAFRVPEYYKEEIKSECKRIIEDYKR